MNQQVVGQVTLLEQRSNGWVAVSILETGKQYAKKLSTKKPELISMAQSMHGQIVTAAYNEVQSDQINPHNNQPYLNRYLEAIAMGQVDLVGMPTQIQPQQYMPQPQPQPQQWTGGPGGGVPVQQPAPMVQPVIGHDPREAKIHRQTATKVAAHVLAFMPPEDQTLASLIRISEQLVQYYDNGVQWQTNPIQPQPVQQPQAQQQHQGGYENPDEYEDIPF